MRIGLMVGPERGRYPTKVERMRADARWAEDAGLTSVWIPQIPDEFDALTAVALVGAETSRIEIGTAVVPVQTRHPIALLYFFGRYRVNASCVSYRWLSPSKTGKSQMRAIDTTIRVF
jgi:hypothetical protein